jgi:hypothetical protein
MQGVGRDNSLYDGGVNNKTEIVLTSNTPGIQTAVNLCTDAAVLPDSQTFPRSRGQALK